MSERTAGNEAIDRATAAEARERVLREAIKDETCIMRKKRDTVICGQSIVEGYLRQGYAFDWHATDIARLSPKDPSDDRS